MAFTFTRNDDVTANRLAYGTFVSSGGSTGGTINTGMFKCIGMSLTQVGATANKAPVLNVTLATDGTFAGNAVPIVTDANASGSWMAIGEA